MAQVKTVQAGELNQRIQILRSFYSEPDPEGYREWQEELVLGCWAKVSFVSGTEMVKANSDFGEVKARFLIRYPDKEIDRKMTVRYRGRDYAVTYVNDYAGQKYLEIWGTWQSREGT